jgi:hypothetical protein
LDLDDSANDDWHRDLHKPRFNTNRRLVKTPNGPVVVHRNVPNKKKGNHQAGGNTGGEESELSLSTVKKGKTRIEESELIALTNAFEQAEREFVIPSLNGSQEEAARCFLNSAEGSSITLVQGPPGTGKTTLLTATICRFLLASTRKLLQPGPDPTLVEEMDSHDGIVHESADDLELDRMFDELFCEEDNMNEIELPRLLVCANSNKAVSVLASRYLRAAQGNTLFHAIMVGDEEKLLADDQPGLRSIYSFTWMDVVIEDWEAIRWLLQDNAKETDELLLQAKALVAKLHAQIPKICKRNKVTPLLNTVIEALEELGACKVSDGNMKEANGHVERSISKLI